MEAQKRSPRLQRLPSQPHKKEEYMVSPRPPAGSRANGLVGVGQHVVNQGLSPRRSNTLANQDMCSACGSTVAKDLPLGSRVSVAASARHPTTAANMRAPRAPPERSRATSPSSASDVPLDHEPKDLVRGGQANGRRQRGFTTEPERRGEHARAVEAAVEARLGDVQASMRADFKSREEGLLSELDEAKDRARRERDEMTERLRASAVASTQLEKERDAGQALAKELEQKLRTMEAAPEHLQQRAKAADMELCLVRSRLAREEEQREAAENACRLAVDQHQRLKADLNRRAAEVRSLQQRLAEQKELATFRQELISDLQAQLHHEKADFDHRIQHERKRFEAASRLHAVLPGQFVLKAMERA